MKLAKLSFWIAAIWGLLILTPLYFLFDSIGRNNSPPITHPDFFYGFVGVALAWQLAFIIIARDPVRSRPLMIPSIFEKFSYAIAVFALVSQGSTQASAGIRGRRPGARHSFFGLLLQDACSRILADACPHFESP